MQHHLAASANTLDLGVPTPEVQLTMSCAQTPLHLQVWRVPDCPAVYQQLLPAFDQLPQHFQSAANYHFGIHAAHPPVALTKAVRQAANRARGRACEVRVVHVGLCLGNPDPGPAVVPAVHLFSETPQPASKEARM